jgi:hypothetical protein
LPATRQRTDSLRRRYPTLTQLAADYNPDKGARYALFPVRCVTGNAPSLVDLKNAYGQNANIQWLIAQIVVYQENVNTPNKMSVAQYTGLAHLIAQEFYFLKCSELLLFFSQLAGGMYNVEYHGYITPDVILDTLRNKYMPYRTRIMHEEYERQQEQELKKQKEMSKDDMTREEWEEIKMLTAMYEMDIRK